MHSNNGTKYSYLQLLKQAHAVVTAIHRYIVKQQQRNRTVPQHMIIFISVRKISVMPQNYKKDRLVY